MMSLPFILIKYLNAVPHAPYLHSNSIPQKTLTKRRKSAAGQANVLMKTKNTLKNLPDLNQSLSERRRIPMALVCAIIMTLLALSGKAANVLVNPGFESSPVFASGSWSQHASETWSMSSGTGQTPNALIHTGNNSLWMQGLYGNGQGGPQTSYAAQDLACFPGNTYTADAWYSAYVNYTGPGIGGSGAGGSGLFGNDGSGNEDGWVEVMFFNSGNVLLADYKSTIIDPAYDANAASTLTLVTNGAGNVYLPWEDFQVTNQYDPTTVTPNTDPDVAGGITNTLGAGQYITAPPGAVKVEFRVSLYQAAYEPGAPFWDDATLNQVGGPSPSIIGNLSPDGTKFFNAASANFTFNVTSASAGGAALPTNATSGVGIVVNGQNETASLQFSGPSTNLSVTLPGLASNAVYSISVSATNSVGLVSSKTVTFDTFPTNVFIVSAEDYDYTNGLFFQNPTPTAAPAANSYYGLAGTCGVDISTYGGTCVLPAGASELVRSDNDVAMQKADDVQLPQYLAANNPNVYNVQIAYNNPGNLENYTRNYPTGNYLVYLRYNDNTPGNYESLNLLTSGYGMPTQTTTNLGEFISAGIGANYAWVPLTDIYGNKIIVNLPAGQNTLQLLSGGIANFVDFIFVPAGTGFPPVIDNLNPNNVNPPVNANIFLNVTNITYSVSSEFSTVATNNIHTLANGVDISSFATYSGNNTNWSVSVPCPQNQLITLVITAKDANGLTNSVRETFDTFSQDNMMIEAVDWDFNGGQFIDNPVPTAPVNTAVNSYYDGGINNTNASVFNVDYDGTYDGEVLGGYRNLDNGFQCEVNADFVRQKFITNGSLDYDLGYYNGGQWANYTRTFPASKYNVYGRLAGGAGPFNNTTLALVTSGRGTTTQTTQALGSFADANAAGWQTWHWVPMRDTNGNLATVSLGGVQTLKATSGNNLNANYYMFVPAVSLSANLTISISGTNIALQFPTVFGHNYTVLYNNTLVGGTWQPLSAAVFGNGAVKTVTDTVAGTVRFYKLQTQ
jgi:hypothetical protein